MNIVFLDIDGVLNNNDTKERCGWFLGVDKFLAKKFTDWQKKRGVDVVLSSTWRLHKDMWPHLKEAGIEWIDVTPSISHPNAIRGDEIDTWLQKQVDPISGRNEIGRYAILDDNPWFLPEQDKFFVQTIDGIKDEDFIKLDEILGFSNEKK